MLQIEDITISMKIPIAKTEGKGMRFLGDIHDICLISEQEKVPQKVMPLNWQSPLPSWWSFCYITDVQTIYSREWSVENGKSLPVYANVTISFIPVNERENHYATTQ